MSGLERVIVDCGAFHLFLCGALDEKSLLPFVPVTEYAELVRRVRAPIDIKASGTNNSLATGYQRLTPSLRGNYDRWLCDFSEDRWKILPGAFHPVRPAGAAAAQNETLVSYLMHSLGEQVGLLGAEHFPKLTKSELILLYYSQLHNLPIMHVEANRTDDFLAIAESIDDLPEMRPISPRSWAYFAGVEQANNESPATASVMMTLNVEGDMNVNGDMNIDGAATGGDTYNLDNANINQSAIGREASQTGDQVQLDSKLPPEQLRADIEKIQAWLDAQTETSREPAAADELAHAKLALEAGDAEEARSILAKSAEKLLHLAEKAGTPVLAAWLKMKLGL